MRVLKKTALHSEKCRAKTKYFSARMSLPFWVKNSNEPTGFREEKQLGIFLSSLTNRLWLGYKRQPLHSQFHELRVANYMALKSRYIYLILGIEPHVDREKKAQ